MPLKCDFLAIGKERPSKVIHKMYKIHACCKQTKLLELKYKDRQWFTHGMWITHCFERRKGNVPWDMEYSRYRRKRIMNSILSPRGGLIGRFLFEQNCRGFERRLKDVARTRKLHMLQVPPCKLVGSRRDLIDLHLNFALILFYFYSLYHLIAWIVFFLPFCLLMFLQRVQICRAGKAPWKTDYLPLERMTADQTKENIIQYYSIILVDSVSDSLVGTG